MARVLGYSISIASAGALINLTLDSLIRRGLLSDNQPVDRQLADGKIVDAGSPNSQAADGDGSDSECANSGSADCKSNQGNAQAAQIL